MKKYFIYFSILACLWACQQETENLDALETMQPDGKTTVLFQPLMPAEITYATDIVPMTRATDDTNRANLSNRYKAIFLKKIENNWFVDTVVTGTPLSSVSPWGYIPVRNNTRFDPIRVELRPGQYKMSLFLNPYNLAWNNSLKPGTFVATEEDLSAGKNLPAAATINVVGENNYRPTPSEEGALMISMEIFSGSTDFTVGKNDHLETNNTSSSLMVQMHRRVGRLRYLLKVNQPTTEPNFGNTQYWMTATLTAPEGKAFCDGLNVLGLPYYAEKQRTQLLLYHSSVNTFYSEKDNTIYQMPVNLPDGFVTPTPSGPTNFAPFILADEPLDCTLTIKSFSGSSGGYIFQYGTPLPFTLKPSGVDGYAFEIDPDYVPVEEGGNKVGRVKLIPHVDVRQSFHLFYELNPVVYNLPKKP